MLRPGPIIYYGPGRAQIFVLGFLILGILLISVFWQYKKLVVIGFCILFLVTGIWRHQQAELRIIDNELKKFNDLEQKITLIGQVIKEPDIREKNIKLTIKPNNIEGKVLVTTNRYPQYQYGDKLKITGFLKTPQELGDFDYPGYLAKDGIYSVLYWPEIELVKKGQGNLIYTKILSFKERLRESIYQNLSPPQSSILGAIILGDKSRISQEWKEKLNYAGVRHLTAVSGMHVAILTSILMTLLIGLGLWRQQAFYFAIILITLFIVMTGLQPSAIRAGIMGGLFLFAQYLGRLNSARRAIVMAGAVMLAQNPLLLRLDVGFQLSFLAILGIIYFLPIFRSWFRKIPNLFQFKNIISITLSAQIFTLPILIYNFGYLSLVAPITNVLILPLLPFIMIFGFIFGLLGMFWQLLGWIFSWPAWLLLTYLAKIVDWFSSQSFAYLTLEISWVWLILLYLVLGLITWRLNEKQKLKFLNY
jgi:competence protein ComEC